MADTAAITPDHLALLADLQGARFLAGEDRGRWKLHKVEWPHVLFEVVARDGWRYGLKLNVAGYPAEAPSGTFWDLQADVRLAFPSWPQGGERINLAFRHDWKGGGALYIPCDRMSIAGHDAWATQYPQLLWDPKRGITKYLEVVEGLLHNKDYRCRNA